MGKLKLETAQKPPVDFVVIGAMRAGTTSIQHTLRGIRKISLPTMKETDFFMPQNMEARGMDWYRNLFDQNAPLRGEISPNYSNRAAFPRVPNMLHQAAPDAKIIYVVRDPVKRAVSQFKHGIAMKIFEPEDNFLSSEEGKYLIAASRYAWQLEAWTQLYPAEQILVLDFHDLKTQPQVFYRELLDFIGLPDEAPDPDLEPKNTSQELSRIPAWWIRLRTTWLGEAIRNTLPNTTASRIKRTITGLMKPTRQADIPRHFERDIADALGNDVARFRQMVGKPFEHWSV